MKSQRKLSLLSEFALLIVGITLSHGVAAQDASSDSPEVIEEVFVKGIRGSIQKAQEIKRDAASVVEAITIEDLGKFADENIADALQRVPGLQVDRNDRGTGGDRVTIRGLGPQFVTTTVNGRTPLSSGSEGIRDLRTFNLDVVPPEILSGVLVHKTPTSNIVGIGLAGSVDLQTLRPLDVSYGDKNYFASINVRGEYEELADDVGPRISGIWGAKNADETVAVSISGIWSETERHRNQQSVREQLAAVNIDDNRNGVLDPGENQNTVPTAGVRQ